MPKIAKRGICFGQIQKKGNVKEAIGLLCGEYGEKTVLLHSCLNQSLLHGEGDFPDFNPEPLR